MTNERSESTTEHDRDITAAAERTVHTLFDVGRLWAAHGLGVGRSALKTSAQTLEATSSLLGELADRFAEERPRAEAAEPTPAEAEPAEASEDEPEASDAA